MRTRLRHLYRGLNALIKALAHIPSQPKSLAKFKDLPVLQRRIFARNSSHSTYHSVKWGSARANRGVTWLIWHIKSLIWPNWRTICENGRDQANGPKLRANKRCNSWKTSQHAGSTHLTESHRHSVEWPIIYVIVFFSSQAELWGFLGLFPPLLFLSL